MHLYSTITHPVGKIAEKAVVRVYFYMALYFECRINKNALLHNVITLDPAKINSIKDLLAPTNVSEIKSLLPNYSTLTEQIRILTKKDTPFIWLDGQRSLKNIHNQKRSKAFMHHSKTVVKPDTRHVSQSLQPTFIESLQTDKTNHTPLSRLSIRILQI